MQGLEKKGLKPVAISADPPEKNRALAKRLSVGFPLLSDPGGKVAKTFGVWDTDAKIAFPATFVITKDGKIVYRYVGANKKDRPSIDDVVEAIAE